MTQVDLSRGYINKRNQQDAVEIIIEPLTTNDRAL